MIIDSLPCKIAGIPNDTYHSLELRDYVSRSYLHAVEKSDGEAQLWLDKGRSLWAGNSATTLGSQFDELVTGLLEGKSFDDLVVCPPAEVLSANGARSGNKYKEWAATQTGVICTADQREQFRLMWDAMCGNDAVYQQLVRATNETQISVFFEVDGNKCKVRPDACTPTVWWDLKTTSHAWDRIYRSVIDYGYDLQAAFYDFAAEALGMEPFRTPFVFVQTVPPYGCRAFVLPEEMVANARARMRSVLEQIRLRRSTGHYMPVEANEITELEIPAWALRKEEEVVL